MSALLRRQQQTFSANASTPIARIGHVRSFSDSHEAAASQLGGSGSASAPIPINERSPLQPKDKAEEGQGCMTSYGSIIGSPPHSDEVTRFNSRQAPSVQLPPPAVDDIDGDDDDAESDDYQVAPESMHLPRNPSRVARPATKASVHPPAESPELHPPASQMAHTGNAYEIRAPRDQVGDTAAPPTSRLHDTFPKRTNSTPDSRPFMKRIFTSSGLSQRSRDDNDVALEAYRELDFRKAEFFLFLDKELIKVEKFYLEKENEGKERLEHIREQLHIMRTYRLAEIMEIEAESRREQAVANGERDSQHSREKGHEGRVRKRDVLVKPFTMSIDFATDALDRVRSGPIGRTSRRMGDLGTPEIPPQVAHWLPDPHQRDYARRPPHEVPYRVAKRKMKLALAEFYRGLELLKSYALLNRTAFRKINKKYDKCVGAKPGLQYVSEKVAKSHFVNSDVPEQLMATVEDLYARYFEKGSRKVAVSKLRTKSARSRDYSGAVARSCALLAAGSVFGALGVVKAVRLLYIADEPTHTYTTYLLQLYGGYFMMVLLALLFCGCAAVFHEFRVNYQFIFELNRRQALHWLELLEVPAFLYFLLGLVMWLNFDIQAGGSTMFIYWIVVLVGLAVISFFLPAPTFYYKARKWFSYTLWRLLFAGLYAVEFRDFFTGDMFCSLTYSMGNIEMFFCLFVGRHWNSPAVCNSGHSRLLGFLTCLPGIWRALQCLRRYYDTRALFPHMVNCFKYFFTIAQYLTLSVYRIDQSLKTKVVFIVFATLNGLYTSIWDLAMDWSLGDPYAKHRFLRPTLAYRKHVWIYYVAMLLDPILRFNWIFYAIYTSDTQHSSIVSFAVSLSEVLRRGMWTLLRVENEHCTNVENAKASRDVPLPYKLPGQSSTVGLIRSEREEAQDEDSGPNTNTTDSNSENGDLAPKQPISAGSPTPSRLEVPEIQSKAGKAPYPNKLPKRDGSGLVPTSEISRLDLDKRRTSQQHHGAGAGGPSRSTQSASGRDVDLERQQSATSSTLRFRRRRSSNVQEAAGSPIVHTLHRVGTTMRNAHVQDYTRKKSPAVTGGQDEDSDDEDDDDDDDDDSDRG